MIMTGIYNAAACRREIGNCVLIKSESSLVLLLCILKARPHIAKQFRKWAALTNRQFRVLMRFQLILSLSLESLLCKYYTPLPIDYSHSPGNSFQCKFLLNQKNVDKYNYLYKVKLKEKNEFSNLNYIPRSLIIIILHNVYNCYNCVYSIAFFSCSYLDK